MASTSTKELGVSDERAERWEILMAANGKVVQGQELASLRKVLRDDPRLWKVTGDLNEQIRCHALKSYEDSSLNLESVKHGMRVMRRELGFEEAGALERMLIEQVITCWVQASMVGVKYEAHCQGSHSMSEGMYWERRYHLSQGRLVRAIEALARVRRVAGPVPVLQVNIAEKQVNVA